MPRVVEVSTPTPAAADLFHRAFGQRIPDTPRHFELEADESSTIGYIHFTVNRPGVFLLGGLCIDAACYRRYGVEMRQKMRREGTWSQLLLRRSIELLGEKRAVFAYTGHRISTRDIRQLGFVSTAHRYLFVQWHAAATEDDRNQLVNDIRAMGPF